MERTNAVIGIDTFVITLQALPTLIPRNPERNSVFGPQLLKFGHHAGGDDRRAFRQQAVHHAFEERQLSLDCVGQEIGVN